MPDKFEGLQTDLSIDKAPVSEALNVKYLKGGSGVGPVEGCDVQASLTNTSGTLSQIYAVTTPGATTPVGVTIAVVGLTNAIEGLGQFVPANKASFSV